jgi:hypothetical protein
MHLAGPEPRLDFGGGPFHCVNTAPSGIEIRAIGVRLIRGDTAASIGVCMPVTIGQLIRSNSIIYVRFSLSFSVGGIAYPVWSRLGDMVQLAVVWSVILFGLTSLTPSIMSISPLAERNNGISAMNPVWMGRRVNLLGQSTSPVIHKAGQVLKH